MPEHLLTDEINNYLSGKLEPNELLIVDDHLAECDVCFEQFQHLQVNRQINNLDFSTPAHLESDHLNYEMLEKYVDEKLNEVDREIADVHLQVCQDCNDELKDLYEMKRAIVADLQKQPSPKPNEKGIFFAGISSFLSGNNLLRFGFAALIILFLVMVIGLFRFLNPEKLNEVAVNSSPSTNISSPTKPNNINENLPTNIQPNANTNKEQNSNSETNSPTPKPTPTDTLPMQYQGEVERVLATNKLNIPEEIKSLNIRTGELMGGGTAEIPFALSDPVGKVILSNRPRLQWGELKGANAYSVNIFDENFNKAYFSNTNTSLKMPIAAPGVNILSSVPNGQYVQMNGTSMATPIVAGLVGILRSLNPNITTAEAYKILKETGLDSPDASKAGKTIQPLAAIERVK